MSCIYGYKIFSETTFHNCYIYVFLLKTCFEICFRSLGGQKKNTPFIFLFWSNFWIAHFCNKCFCLLSWCLFFLYCCLLISSSIMEWFPWNWRMTVPQLTKVRPKYPLLVIHKRQSKWQNCLKQIRRNPQPAHTSPNRYENLFTSYSLYNKLCSGS